MSAPRLNVGSGTLRSRWRRALAARGLVRPRLVRRFKREEGGVAAVEFALVAAPFLFILFAIIEVSLVFFASQILETATANASRLILTGQASSQNFDQSKFKSAICANVAALMSCSGISVDVRTYASFGSASTSGPRTGTGAVDYSALGYSSGAGGQIVVVRVLYEWPVLLPTFGLTIGDLPNGNRLLMATSAFRNEPF